MVYKASISFYHNIVHYVKAEIFTWKETCGKMKMECQNIDNLSDLHFIMDIKEELHEVKNW